MTDHNVTEVMAEHRKNRSKKYAHRGAGTETWEQECDNSDGDDFEKGPDVPFPGDEGLKAMMED